MEYYSVIRILIEMLIYAMTWMDLKNVMLSKRSQAKKTTLYDFIYMKHPEKSIETKWLVVAWNWGGDRTAWEQELTSNQA